MHVITRKRLLEFSKKHWDAEIPLDRWYRIVKYTDFESFSDLQKLFPNADQKVLTTPYTEDQYNKAVKLLDELIDEVSENENPMIESLIDTLGTLVKDYEDRNLTEQEVDPADSLNHQRRCCD